MILIQLFLVEKFLIMLIRSKGDQKDNKLRFRSMHVYPFRPCSSFCMIPAMCFTFLHINISNISAESMK